MYCCTPKALYNHGDGGGGVSSQPPPMCRIHLDDVTAATGQWHQCTHHTPATGGVERRFSLSLGQYHSLFFSRLLDLKQTDRQRKNVLYLNLAHYRLHLFTELEAFYPTWLARCLNSHKNKNRYIFASFTLFMWPTLTNLYLLRRLFEYLHISLHQ